MNKTERDEVRRLVYDFEQWGRKAADARAWQQAVRAEALRGERRLAARAVALSRAGRLACKVIPLRPEDTDVVLRLRERHSLPTPTEHDAALVRLLTQDAPRAIADAHALGGVRRLLSGPETRHKADVAAGFLRDAHDSVLVNDGPTRLERLGAPPGLVDPQRLRMEDLLEPGLGFTPVSECVGPASQLLERQAFAGLPEALDAIAKAVTGEGLFRLAVRAAGERVRRTAVQRMLRDMPLETLRTATRDRLRLGPLAKAGVNNVQKVLDQGSTLELLPGVGVTSARRMLGAARALWQTTYDEMPVRVDITSRPPETTELLSKLAAWDSCRRVQGQRRTSLASPSSPHCVARPGAPAAFGGHRGPAAAAILAGKRRLFDDFARVSETADSTPEAVDLSEADLVKQVVAAERRRLLDPVTADA